VRWPWRHGAKSDDVISHESFGTLDFVALNLPSHFDAFRSLSLHVVSQLH